MPNVIAESAVKSAQPTAKVNLTQTDFNTLARSTLQRWESVLTVDPQNELALLNVLGNAMALNHQHLVADSLSRLRALDNIINKARYFELQAKEAAERGDHEAAIHYWREASHHGYNTQQGCLRIATQYYQLNDMTNARLYAVRASEDKNGDKGTAEYSIVIQARCFSFEKNWDAAIDLLQHYQQFDVHRETAAELLYRCYINDFRYESARSVCEVFKERNEAKYQHFQGKVLMRQHLYNEAIEHFNAAFGLSHNIEDKLWMIRTLAAIHDHDSAEKQAELAELTLTQNSLTQGKCWEAAGVLSRAEERYRQAAEEDASYEAHSAYIRFLFNQRNWGEAYRALLKADKDQMTSPALDRIRGTLMEAFTAAGKLPPTNRFLLRRFEFFSSESMVTGIVDRLLNKHRVVNAGRIAASDENAVLVIGSLGAGGAERQVVNLANGLAAADDINQVTLLCTHLSRVDQDRFYLPQVNDAVKVEEYYQRADVLSPDDIPELSDYADLLKHIQPASRLQVILHLARALIEIKPTVVHGWLDETFINTALVCHMLGIRNVVGRWGSMPPGVNRTVNEKTASNVQYLQHAYREIARLPCLKYSSNSRLTGNAYAELLRKPARAVNIVYNGINTDESTADKDYSAGVRRLWGIPATGRVVGTIFRISEEKRPFLWVDTAIELTTREPDLQFVIVGGGPLENQLQDYIRERQANNIHLVGRQANVALWYRLFDVLLLTSRVEGVSNVVVESQFASCPVVAPDVGGLSEAMVDQETGYLLQDHSVTAFADAVQSLINDPEKLDRVGKCASRFARERFSVDKMVASYRRLFNDDIPGCRQKRR